MKNKMKKMFFSFFFFLFFGRSEEFFFPFLISDELKYEMNEPMTQTPRKTNHFSIGFLTPRGTSDVRIGTIPQKSISAKESSSQTLFSPRSPRIVKKGYPPISKVYSDALFHVPEEEWNYEMTEIEWSTPDPRKIQICRSCPPPVTVAISRIQKANQ